MAGILIRCGLVLGLVSMFPAAFADQVVADPMRPPVTIAVDPAAMAEEGGASHAPVLQSVIMPRTGKPVAIIGGQQVRLGEKFGESRLVRLNERGAVLDGPGGIEHLLLTPLVEKVDEKRSENRTMTVAKSGQRKGGQ